MYLADLGGVEGVDRCGLYLHRAARSIYICGGPNPLRRVFETFVNMRSQLFVIHTLSSQEQKVKESIEKRIKPEEMGDFIQEVLVPMEKVVEVRNQKKTVSTRKLHPGYVYIHMALLDENNKVIP